MFTGNINIAILLLTRYAEINAKDDEGKTPLHLACMLGNLAMVQRLMQRADCMVNAQDNSGNTPLHVACNSLNEPIIRSIKMSNKADFGILNNDHKKAADVLKYKAKQAG